MLRLVGWLGVVSRSEKQRTLQHSHTGHTTTPPPVACTSSGSGAGFVAVFARASASPEAEHAERGVDLLALRCLSFLLCAPAMPMQCCARALAMGQDEGSYVGLYHRLAR